MKWVGEESGGKEKERRVLLKGKEREIGVILLFMTAVVAAANAIVKRNVELENEVEHIPIFCIFHGSTYLSTSIISNRISVHPL